MLSGRLFTPPCALTVLNVPPELRRDHDLVANRLKCFTDEFLVREGAVHLSRVEEGHTELDRSSDQRDHRILVGVPSVRSAHAHTTEADRRDFKAAE